MTRWIFTTLTLCTIFLVPASAAPPMGETLKDSVDVLNELSQIQLKGIPPALLADAQGVAIIPHVVKAGFIVGGSGGHGVVVTRGPDGTWSNLTFISIGGASVGLQAGVQSADVVLVFKTRKGLDRLLNGKNKLTLGADVSIAAGPIGRQAEAATDGKLQAEIVSYSRTRGLFAGVALDGAVIHNERDLNARFAFDAGPETIKAAEALRARLTEMCAPPAVIPAAPTITLPLPPMVPPPASVPLPSIQQPPPPPPLTVPTR